MVRVSDDDDAGGGKVTVKHRPGFHINKFVIIICRQLAYVIDGIYY